MFKKDYFFMISEDDALNVMRLVEFGYRGSYMVKVHDFMDHGIDGEPLRNYIFKVHAKKREWTTLKHRLRRNCTSFMLIDKKK